MNTKATSTGRFHDMQDGYLKSTTLRELLAAEGEVPKYEDDGETYILAFEEHTPSEKKQELLKDSRFS